MLKDSLSLAFSEMASFDYLFYILKPETRVPQDYLNRIFSNLSDERQIEFLRYIKSHEECAPFQEAAFNQLRIFWIDKKVDASTLFEADFSEEWVLNGPFSQLSISISTSLLESLANNTTLTSLDCSINSDSSEAAVTLAWVLNQNQTLKSLSMPEELFSCLEIWNIFKGLENNTALAHLAVSQLHDENKPFTDYLEWSKCLSKNTALTSLFMNYGNFNSVAALLTVTTLKSLGLNGVSEKSGDEFLLDEAENFLSALKNNTTLRALDIGCLCQEGSNNDGKEEKLKFETDFAEAISLNTTLQSLQLFDMWISDEGKNGVFDAIKTKTNLTSLSLSQHLQGQQVKDTAKFIKNSPKLTSLELIIDFDQEGAREFSDAVKMHVITHKTLERLSLYYSDIPPDCAFYLDPLKLLPLEITW